MRGKLSRWLRGFSAEPLRALQGCLLALERQRDRAATGVARVDQTVDQPGAGLGSVTALR